MSMHRGLSYVTNKHFNMKIRTQWAKREYNARENEIAFSASQTIPDQSMTIQQILDRHSRGLPIEGQKVSMWDGDNDSLEFDDYLPDPATLDLAEKQALREAIREELQDLEQKRQASMAAARKRQEPAKPLSPTQKVEADDITHEEAPKPVPKNKPAKPE